MRQVHEAQGTFDASKSQRGCIILSQFTRKSKYAVIKSINIISVL